ncbi:RNA-binding protein 4 [Heterocephalus glaber]|uniref:RNA-binding protein 4 n=1 Tax=Heterocephalus glaber TaxID=10181 RepID=G5C9Q1_HETGA|nr:RNA-binding protein 4 [Heterocephalus glaber]
MVKLFIGNLPQEATEQEIRSRSEQCGQVRECDIIKNYAFLHAEDETAAEDAKHNLHHYKLHGVNINVEASKNKGKASTKLHVGNISPTCTNKELRAKREEYGPVIECDIVKDYAFVHMEPAEDAVEAIRGLDNTEFQGKRMHVQLSTSWLDRSPLHHATGPVTTVGEGYGYRHESGLSQASAAARNSLYDMAPYEREQYADRAQYSAF